MVIKLANTQLPRRRQPRLVRATDGAVWNIAYCFFAVGCPFFFVYIRSERRADTLTLPPSVQAVHRSAPPVQIAHYNRQLFFFSGREKS